MVDKYPTVYKYPIVCIHSSVLLQLTCFPVLAVVPSGAKITSYVSIKILVVSTRLSRLQPSPDMRLSLLRLQEWKSSPTQGGRGE